MDFSRTEKLFKRHVQCTNTHVYGFARLYYGGKYLRTKSFNGLRGIALQLQIFLNMFYSTPFRTSHYGCGPLTKLCECVQYFISYVMSRNIVFTQDR